MTIDDDEFQLLRDLVYQRFGIHLSEQKKSLVVGRLQKDLQSKGFKSFGDYYTHLTKNPSPDAFSNLINRISTNYSFFYRENAHFDYFSQTLLPELVARLRKQGSNDVRIWCAGCSTCEEPYTLVMLMLEFFGLDYASWDAGILATDISERVLTVGRHGIYPAERVSQAPKNLQERYFKKHGAELAVVESVKKEVVIRRFNLMNPFPFKRPFQVIFCRNVMIYFDKVTRDSLIRRFHAVLEPGGYLFVGHSETVSRDNGLFAYVQPALYRKI
ncbi:MAG: protein-glutamate O-methyltransferase CheR [Proteobacteria bacterium]|nr:protein-glutamate O-methyltransferase CheR [Pseudomonadota bacterium]MBU1640017.1 protein-glutamate O-methyltransferase CheR [Pseudomonadota bacterium]